MNTITTTATTNTILAIDLGKYKRVVCILDESIGEYRFTTFDVSRSEPHKLIAKEQPAVVLSEACLLAGDQGAHCRPASHLPCSRGKTGRRRFRSTALAPGDSLRCVTDWKNVKLVG